MSKKSCSLSQTDPVIARPSNGDDKYIPDISQEIQAEVGGKLQQVGMEAIEVPVSLGAEFKVPARVDAFVSLDNEAAKGIHMSRLYMGVLNHFSHNSLSGRSLKKLVRELAESQEGLSQAAYLRVAWEHPLQRPALKSDLMGWRYYPSFMEVRWEQGESKYFLGSEVLYSSTCPCSAALARQLVQEKFMADFSAHQNVTVEEMRHWLGQPSSMAALPHAQRSRASFKVQLSDVEFAPDIKNLVTIIENVLATPVQTAVKRQDEQEFARLNAENLMFCEDAARKIQAEFNKENRILDFDVQVEHYESLHPHNAVARVVKGIPGGFHP